MRVLMLSFDDSMLTPAAQTAGDTQARHIKYAAALRNADPEAHLSVIVKTAPGRSAQPVALADGLTIYPIPCRRWEFGIKAWPVIRECLNHLPHDLVTTQSPFDDGALGVQLKRRFRLPLNVQMRSSFLDVNYWVRERPVIYRGFNALGKWVARQADSIRVVCDGEKHRLEQIFPYLHGKVIALHPLINFDLFASPLRPEETEQVHRVLQAHGLTDLPIFLFVGRLVQQKNIPTLLSAFARVNQQVRSTLVMAGDGELRDTLQRIARQSGIAEQIIWLGNLPLARLRGWYAAACASVLPSFHEGFGKVIVESYLMGTPVIATPFVSADELIQNGKTGYVLSGFTDSDELAHKMTLLAESPALAKEYGRKGDQAMTTYLLPEDEYLQRLLVIWENTVSQAAVRRG